MEGTYFPILIELSQFPALIVGGGKVAMRKAINLIEFGGKITIIAPEVIEELKTLITENKITYLNRHYEHDDAKNYKLVFCATGNEKVDKLVNDDCKTYGILLNVADVPTLCNFIMPATIKRSNLTISVATQGEAPFFAKYIKEYIEKEIPEIYSDIVDLAGLFRKLLLKKIKINVSEKRTEMIELFLNEDWEKIISEQGKERALKKVLDMLENIDNE